MCRFPAISVTWYRNKTNNPKYVYGIYSVYIGQMTLWRNSTVEDLKFGVYMYFFTLITNIRIKFFLKTQNTLIMTLFAIFHIFCRIRVIIRVFWVVKNILMPIFVISVQNTYMCQISGPQQLNYVITSIALYTHCIFHMHIWGCLFCFGITLHI